MNASRPLRIALAQFDFPLGAVAANAARIAELIATARDTHGADLVVFPELALSGSPPLDLVQRRDFMTECARGIASIAAQTRGIVAVVGWPALVDGEARSALSVLREGVIAAIAHAALPDPAAPPSEPRALEAAGAPCLFEVNGVTVGLAPSGADAAALAALAQAGAALALLPAASAYEHGALEREGQHLAAQAAANGLALARVNAVGAQDAWIFHGAARLIDGSGQAHPPTRAFDETWALAQFDPATRRFAPIDWPTETDASRLSLIWRALVAGIRGYARKNGIRRAVLGLSGGLDSAMVAALTVEALGADNLTAVRLPSRYTSALSNALAQAQADLLGVRLLTLPIEATVEAALGTLAPELGQVPGLVEENLQSRARGLLLMALANAEGALLLATGNKSEAAAGYCTLYGDTCGGYAPLKDVFKTEIFALARWRNAQGDGARIPTGVIERAPSAELRENQRDEDSLPPYAVLDALLERHLDDGLTAEELVAQGFEAGTVTRVLQLLRSSEWKRAQGASGPRLSRSAFGSVRQMPVTCGYTG